MSIFAKAQNSWITGFIKKIFRIQVINAENEPIGSDSGGFIVCANHSSNWDPIIIGACMHRPLRYMAKAELFKVPILKSIIKWFGAYPVNRERADVSSIKTTISILEQGESVGMYMQGRRQGGVHPRDITPKNGSAMIAAKAKSGVLPVTIITKGHKVRMFRKTVVVFGRYMPFGEFEESGADADVTATIKENMSLYKKITDIIYSEIVGNYNNYDTLNK